MAQSNGSITGQLRESHLQASGESLRVLIRCGRIALAFELLTPNQVCSQFARALNRQVSYEFSLKIDIEVPIPKGYHEQLLALEILFGRYNAPYFGADLEKGLENRTVGPETDDASKTVVQEARSLWGGWRGLEEYAREVFPVEEENNGLTWMKDEENG